jgi:hypothetical protein
MSNAYLQGGVPPTGHLTTFTFNRIELNSFGFLKNTSPSKSKMLIGVLLLLRIAVNQLLLRHHTHLDVPLLPKAHANFKAIAACIYYTFIKHFYQTIPLIAQDSNILTINNRPLPRIRPFVAEDGMDASKIPSILIGEDDIIYGMPSIREMSVLESNVMIYGELKAGMEGF